MTLEKQIDDEMPEEPGPNWICSICEKEFQSETMLNLHNCR